MDGLVHIAEQQAEGSRWFDDFYLGERFVLTPRILTTAMLRSFADASGEANPLQSSDAYRVANDLPGPLAHVLLVAIQTIIGADAPALRIDESLVSMLDQSSRSVRPVYAGDTLAPVLQVVELAPSLATGIVSLRSTVHNERRELVMEGTQRWLLRKRPEA